MIFSPLVLFDIEGKPKARKVLVKNQDFNCSLKSILLGSARKIGLYYTISPASTLPFSVKGIICTEQTDTS